MKKVLLAVLCLAFIVPPAFALKVGGMNFPEGISAGSEKLVLNGAGLRKKLRVVKVYAGGLYLLQKQSDPAKIIAADEAMAITMRWIHNNVEKEKVVAGWMEGFTNATGGNLAPIQKQINQFNDAFPETSKKNDLYEIVYQPSVGVVVSVNGVKKTTITGMEFKKAVFGIWLGDKLADKSLVKLKQSMLGR